MKSQKIQENDNKRLQEHKQMNKIKVMDVMKEKENQQRDTEESQTEMLASQNLKLWESQQQNKSRRGQKRNETIPQG